VDGAPAVGLTAIALAPGGLAADGFAAKSLPVSVLDRCTSVPGVSVAFLAGSGFGIKRNEKKSFRRPLDSQSNLDGSEATA
jgi:hypothetical protein